MASDIGHVLRDARHSRGVTLSDAARHTGVRETHLAALERDELEIYGIDPVYVRGIVRAYADYLDLDSAALLTGYRAGGAPPAGRGVRAAVTMGATPSTRARGRRTVTAVAGVLEIPQNTEEPGELTMKLEFTDTVWVRVLVDGRNKLEGIMRPGAVTQFAGKDEIQLRIGVPEAVEFSLNGAWYGTVASNHDGPVNVTCTTDSACEVTEVE